MTIDVVVSTRAAPERRARRVTNDGGRVRWRHAFVSEVPSKAAKGSWSVLLASAAD
jgi:hypothetical protein